MKMSIRIFSNTAMMVLVSAVLAPQLYAQCQNAPCSPAEKDAYREKVCNTSSWGNDGVRRQLEIQAGITFAQLCSTARAEAGLSSSPPNQPAGQFSPSNKRTAVQNAGAAMVGPLGASAGASSKIEGN